jgi:DnaJ-class molecular chaperone
MKSEIRDCYSILGIRREASPEEIRSAKDKLLSEFHPDMFPEHREEVRAFAFQRNAEIEVAFQILTDRHKKEEHDRVLKELDEVQEARSRKEKTDSEVNEVMEMIEDLIITGLRDFLYKRAKSEKEKAALKTLISEKDPPIKWDFSTFEWSERAMENRLKRVDEIVEALEL